MIKKLLEKAIGKIKNKKFKFDENLTSLVLLSMILNNLIQLFRGLKLLLYFKIPNLLFLGKGVIFFNIYNINLGKSVKLGDFVYLSALGKNPLILSNNVSVGAFSRIITSTTFNNLGSGIIIGNNVGIGEFAYIGGAGGLEIGDDTIVGQYFSTHPENHIFTSKEVLIRNQPTTRNGIKIGSNCWIGSKVTILDGVSVGNRCVIAAGAVVTKTFGDNLLIGGVPAKIIKSI